MTEIICDTSFLIPLATSRIKNISNLDVEIGQVSFVVPRVVISELEALLQDDSKKHMIAPTLDFIKDKKILDIEGRFADGEIIKFVRTHGGIVATLDKKLKTQIKDAGGSIVSLSNDRIVLES